MFGIKANDPRKGRQKFVGTLVNADFTGIATGDVAITGGQWGLLGYYTVPFGMMVAWGADDNTGATNRAGRVAYINMAASGGTAIAGSYRLVVSDPTRSNFVKVDEVRSERSAGSATDRQTAWLLEEKLPLVQPQSRLELWAKPDATATYDYNEATSLIRIPVTNYI